MSPKKTIFWFCFVARQKKTALLWLQQRKDMTSKSSQTIHGCYMLVIFYFLFFIFFHCSDSENTYYLNKFLYFYEDGPELSFPTVLRKLPKVLRMSFKRHQLSCYRSAPKTPEIQNQSKTIDHRSRWCDKSNEFSFPDWYFQNSADNILGCPLLWWIAADHDANMWCWKCERKSSQIFWISVCSSDRQHPHEQRNTKPRQGRL